MKTKRLHGLLVAAATVGCFAFFGPSAQADTSIAFSTPTFSISFGDHDSHHDRFYRPPVRTYRPTTPVYRFSNRHECRYVTQPVQRSFIDRCGRSVFYTEHERVKVCEAFHRPGRGRGHHGRHWR